MANPTYTNVNQYGVKYLFGLRSADAPTITGFKAIEADLKLEAPVAVEAMDGEGLTDSLTITKGDKSKITGSFKGYITDIAAYAVIVGESFVFTPPGTSDARRFIILEAGLPLRQGQLVEASLTVVSHALIEDDHD